MTNRRRSLLVAVALTLCAARVAGAQGVAPKSPEPYAVEYYYKVKWGSAQEFWALFLKNHYPILQRDMTTGRILSVRAEAPRYHGTEDGRWDYRVTIVFKSAEAAVTADDPGMDAWLKQKYPDQAAFEREEQRRFELLIAHWDQPIAGVSLPR